jgi:16S rRNA (adenine1518-N6/adenine1519-N6)-dimethyltransferase
MYNERQHLKKSLGQHFLTDQNILSRLVKAINPRHGLRYVEIGPGSGALTRHILPLVDALTVIEIDRDIIPLLQQECAGLGTLKIIESSVLNVDFTELAGKDKLQVFGNLPYNISTPILFHLIEHLDVVDEMHFMLQEEVVDRLVAKPDTKDYGRLTVMVQSYCNVQKLFTVPPGAFRPPPKVYSAVARLTPKTNNDLMNSVDKTLFSHIVNVAFQQRRKTIRNSLKSVAQEDDLIAVGLDPKARAENLSVQDFVNLARLIKDRGVS